MQHNRIPKFLKYCKCGCGYEIIWKTYYVYYGIPNYLHGHNCPKHDIIWRMKHNINQSDLTKRQWQNYTDAELRIVSEKISKKAKVKGTDRRKRQGQTFKKYLKTDKGILQLKNSGFAAALSPKTFHYYSDKNAKELYYHSTYELAAFKILEQLNIVKSYDRCRFSIPYELDDKTHIYIPDIIVTYQDGSREIIEIKPEFRMKHPMNVAKFEALRYYCMNNELKYAIWNETQLFN